MNQLSAKVMCLSSVQCPSPSPPSFFRSPAQLKQCAVTRPNTGVLVDSHKEVIL